MFRLATHFLVLALVVSFCFIQPCYAAPTPVSLEQINEIVKTMKDSFAGFPQWIKCSYDSLLPISSDIKENMELSKLTTLHKKIVAHIGRKTIVGSKLKNFKKGETAKWIEVRADAATVALTGQSILSDLASVDSLFAKEPSYKVFNNAFVKINSNIYDALNSLEEPSSEAEISDVHTLGSSLDELVTQINTADDALTSCISKLEARIAKRSEKANETVTAAQAASE